MSEEKKQKVTEWFYMGGNNNERIQFVQNPTTKGYSDGYSIRYGSTTVKSRNGWVSLGTVKEYEIETVQKTILTLFSLISNEEVFISKCRKIYRKKSSSVVIERKIPYELESAVNKAIDEIIYEYCRDLEEVQTTLEGGLGDD